MSNWAQRSAHAFFFANDWTTRVVKMEEKRRLARGDKITRQVLHIGKLAWARFWRIQNRAKREELERLNNRRNRPPAPMTKKQNTTQIDLHDC